MSDTDESDEDPYERAGEYVYGEWSDYSRPPVYRDPTPFDDAADALTLELRGATTSQLDRLDALAEALVAKRAALRPLALPRPPARPRAWGVVGLISDPLQHSLSFCFAEARGAAAATCRCWRAAAPTPARSLRMALGRWKGRTKNAVRSWSAPFVRFGANRCAYSEKRHQ